MQQTNRSRSVKFHALSSQQTKPPPQKVSFLPCSKPTDLDLNLSNFMLCHLKHSTFLSTPPQRCLFCCLSNPPPQILSLLPCNKKNFFPSHLVLFVVNISLWEGLVVLRRTRVVVLKLPSFTALPAHSTPVLLLLSRHGVEPFALESIQGRHQ